MLSGAMAGRTSAVLLPAIRLAAAAGGPPDAGLLDGWLALWALAEAGAAGEAAALATALARRAPAGEDPLADIPADAPPAPVVAAATVLALHALGPQAAADGALRGLQGWAAQSVGAAWRPDGRFAFTRQSVPVAPAPLELALAVAAWTRLSDPVAQRRHARAAGVMGALARLPAEAPPGMLEPAAAAALWAAAELLRHAGLAEARAAVLAAGESRLRAAAPPDPELRAVLALGLATAAAALAPADPQPAEHLRRGAARLLRDEAGGALPVRAVALALAAAALLPAAAPEGAAVPQQAALRPALRPAAPKR